MPLIKVQTSVALPAPTAVEGLLKILSAKLATHLGKPESYVMTAFEPEVAMTFAGTVEPVCYIEVKSIGNMSPAQTKAMSQDFCQVVTKSSVYRLIEFILSLLMLRLLCGAGMAQRLAEKVYAS